MRPARDEDEVGRRGRIGDQASPLIVDQQAAIEAFADLDAAAGIGAPVRAAGNLEPPRPEADGVVAGDHPRVPAGEARRRNCRGVMFKSRAPAIVVIFPATANRTRPGRRASLRLIVTVSHVSMG